jgi:hypothetical protein
MKELLYLLFLVAVCLFLNACEDGMNCTDRTGDIITLERDPGEFDSIALYDNVNLLLTQDTFTKVSVRAGSGIIDGISTEVLNHQLIIRNLNICNWLRSYHDSAYVNVTYSSRKTSLKIYYNASGNIRTTNVFMNDTLQVDGWGGSGEIELIVNIHTGTFIQHMGTADIKIRGISEESKIYAGDYGLIDCRNLKSGYTIVKNYGSNNCFVTAIHELNATIGSIGDIYYRSNPAPHEITVEINGTGHLIPM